MHEITVAPLLFLREPFCALSHLFGAVVFVILTGRLIRAGDRKSRSRIGLAVLALTTVQTLVVSSLYHAQWPGPWRQFLLRADVANIFCLIAGSITPVHLILFRGTWRWLPLALSWSAALCGATNQLLFSTGGPGITGTLLMLALGWSNAITAYKVFRRCGWKFVQKPVLAGLCYTVGAVILVKHSLVLLPAVIGPHEIWHVAVLCALSLQWMFLFDLLAMLRKKKLMIAPPPEMTTPVLLFVPAPAVERTSHRRAA